MPPLCDPVDGHLLLDGGYTNNLPGNLVFIKVNKTELREVLKQVCISMFVIKKIHIFKVAKSTKGNQSQYGAEC